MSGLSVAVIGAGVVGMSAALQLVGEGHAVTVFDSRPPGTACSYGNSGGIGIGLVAPIAMPGIGRQAPRMLLDPDEPLFISPRHLVRKAEWFYRFWRSSRRKEVERISAQRAALNHAVLETLEPLLARAGAEELIVHEGMVFVFSGAAPSAQAQARFEIGRRHGIEARPLSPDQLRAINPDLKETVSTAVMIPGNRHCTDPGGLVERYAAAFRRDGGRIVPLAVRHIEPGERPGIATEAGTERFDRVVVAGGVWSRQMAARLGTHVPMEAERGYHLMLPEPGIRMQVPTTLSDRNIVMTPMAGGLRITGIAEFDEPEAPPRWNRAHNLLTQARSYFPGLDGTGARTWVGPRPSTPDSLPVIGRAPGHRGIVYAFGHGQSGLAHASVTARLVADLVAERPLLLDISAFDPGRFSKR